jgi:hypothetical protein
MGRDNDFWDWENNMESVSLRWRHDVEYIMTAKGLERVDNLKDDDDNNNNDENSNETIEQFRKSKEQMQREKEQKLRELQEIDRELQKSDSTLGDSTRYRYKPSTPATPQTKKPKRTDIASTEVTGLSDMLMIKFAL